MFKVGDTVIILEEHPWRANLSKGEIARVTGIRRSTHTIRGIREATLDINGVWSISSFDAKLYDSNDIDWWANKRVL